MQLYIYPSKWSPGELYQIIYVEPLDLAIEAYLVEEGGVGRIIYQASELLIK